MSMKKPKKFKLVLLGEGRVGKTSILVRFIKGAFDEKSASTVAASYLDKNLVIDGTAVALSVWDTAGQERFHALGPLYYRDADAAIIVYDITHAESFTRAQNWVRELRKIVGKDICIAIAGNKIDLEKNRQVNHEEAVAWAKSVGAAHVSTSAKLNKGLDDIFTDLTKQMLLNSADSDSSLSSSGGSSADARSRQSKKLLIVEDSGSTKKEGGCC